eukprot:292581_1
MTTIHCQDICVYNAAAAVPNGATFTFSYFNRTRGSNVYSCHDCLSPVYLFGWVSSKNSYSWHIGFDINDERIFSECALGNDHLVDDYIFNLADCFEVGTWDTKTMTIKACNTDIA